MKCVECAGEFEGRKRKYCTPECAKKAHRRQQAKFEFDKRTKLVGPDRRCHRCKTSLGPRCQGIMVRGKRLCDACKVVPLNPVKE